MCGPLSQESHLHHVCISAAGKPGRMWAHRHRGPRQRHPRLSGCTVGKQGRGLVRCWDIETFTVAGNCLRHVSYMYMIAAIGTIPELPWLFFSLRCSCDSWECITGIPQLMYGSLL